MPTKPVHEYPDSVQLDVLDTLHFELKMATKLNFVTLDVFTTTPYKGNPLAVVHLPPGHGLTQDQKQRIAREFNYSETTFIHDVDPKSDTEPTIRHFDIFMTDRELPFAGHPTIGTASYLSSQGVTKLIAKAGPIPIQALEDGSVAAGIPHDTHLNSKTFGDIEASLRGDVMHATPEIRSAELSAPIFSITKGMTFTLIKLETLDLLSQIYPRAMPCAPKAVMDQEWSNTLIGRSYYVITDTVADGPERRTVKIRTRMVVDVFEDPATGSAGCALTSYLALHQYSETEIRFEVTQGVEMGRESHFFIIITTSVGENGVRKVKTVQLGGKARQIMEGSLIVPPA